MGIEDHIQAKFKSEQHKAIVNIRFTSNWIGNFYNKKLSEYNLSLPQFNILRILRGANEKLSVNVVKERMLEKSPNTTRLIDKLIQKKFVKRMRSKLDRRIVYVQITDDGLSTLKNIDQSLHELNLEGSLNKEEALELNRLLDKFKGE